MVLLGFAVGWALLAVLSVRFSDQPQRWAAAPAVFMAVVGVASLIGSATVHDVLGWMWPLALFVLVVWMLLRARRQLHSRSARWLLYPVLAVLGIAAVGGGYETVRESLDARAYPPPGQLFDVGGHQLHLQLHRLREPDRRPGTGSGWGLLRLRLDCAGGRPRHHSLRVRPRRSRLERRHRRPTGRCSDRRRPAHAARPGAGSRALRAGRPLLRRPLRPKLRRAVSGSGRRPGAPRLHRTQARARLCRPSPPTTSSVVSPPSCLRSLTSEPDG